MQLLMLIFGFKILFPDDFQFLIMGLGILGLAMPFLGVLFLTINAGEAERLKKEQKAKKEKTDE